MRVCYRKGLTLETWRRMHRVDKVRELAYEFYRQRNIKAMRDNLPDGSMTAVMDRLILLLEGL